MVLSATVLAGTAKIDGYNWLDIAVADDGTILACNKGGDLYFSTDVVANFAQVAGYDAIRVSINSTGTMMAHVNKKGDLYYSTDRGKTWVKSEGAYNVIDVCATRSIHFHVNLQGEAYASTDFVTWTKTKAVNELRAMFDGWKLFTLSRTGGVGYVYLYKSPTDMVYYKTESYDFVDSDIAPDGAMFAINLKGDVYTAPNAYEGVVWTQIKEIGASGI